VSKNVIMPALGMAQETGTLIRWLKAPGERVAKGEPLMEIETDKATVEIEAPATGVLVDVTAQPGDEVAVGKTIAVILAPGESAAASDGPTPAPPNSGTPTRSLSASPVAAPPSTSASARTSPRTPRRWATAIRSLRSAAGPS